MWSQAQLFDKLHSCSGRDCVDTEFRGLACQIHGCQNSFEIARANEFIQTFLGPPLLQQNQSVIIVRIAVKAAQHAAGLGLSGTDDRPNEFNPK